MDVLLCQRFGVGQQRPDGHSDLVEDVAFGTGILAPGTGLQVSQIRRDDRLQDRLHQSN